MRTYVMNNMNDYEVHEVRDNLKKRKNLYISLYISIFVAIIVAALLPDYAVFNLIGNIVMLYALVVFIIAPGAILFLLNTINFMDRGKTSNILVRWFWIILGGLLPLITVYLYSKIEPIGGMVAGVRVV